MNTSKHETEGVINASELYTLRAVVKRLGLTDSAMKELRRKGLPLIRIGKRAFASGRQLIEFFEKGNSHENESASESR